MLRYSSLVALCLIGSTVALVAERGVVADDVNHAKVLAPFVNDDTVAVVYVDVASIKVAENAGALLQLLPKASGDTQSLMLGAMMADGLIHRFQQAGGQGAYVVAGLGDIRIGGGPVAIAITEPGTRPEQLEQLFRDLIREMTGMIGQSTGDNRRTPAAVFRQGIADQIDVLRKDNVVLIGPKSSVARYAALKSSPRTELIEPLAKLIDGGAKVAAVFCPGSDYRRVSRELWPELPGALAPLRGELADRWLRFELSVNPPPNARPRLTLVAKDPEGAEIFAKLWRDLPTAATEFGGNEQSKQQAKNYAQLLVDSLPVKVEGTKATIELPTDENQFAKLRSMITEAADKSMESSHRNQRMNQFKQLMIAMNNYHDIFKHLPPAAICGKDGKPLLSWRVAILPYLEENELYKKFHLDEPWDSPHNSTLIKMMPALYADPDRRLKSLASEGKTTYQVPVGPETAFYDSVGAPFRELKDGTSKTVLVVEVEPSRAVVWTKPDDWKVDLANPRQGLERTDREYVTLGYADAHVSIVDPRKFGDQPLRALITRAGREVIDRP